MAKKPGTWPKKPAQAKKELPVGLARALATKKKSADTEALLSNLIEIWGGPEKLARDIYKEFTNATTGGMTRQRILEMVQRLLIQATDRGIGHAVKPSELSDDDLDSIVLSYVERVSGNTSSNDSIE